MSGEIAILILATLAVVLDLLHSVVSIPNIVAMGLRSSPNPDEEEELRLIQQASHGDEAQVATALGEEGTPCPSQVLPPAAHGEESGHVRVRPDGGACEACSAIMAPFAVYYFAIQNNEEVPVEWGGRELDVLLSIRGDGNFREDKPILVTCGPDDEISAFWSRERSEITLCIPRMRPLKTWVIRCYVDAAVNEMSLSVRIPTRSTVRRLAQKINATLFAFHNLDYHQTFILTRRLEDAHYSSRPFRRLRGLAWTIIPSSIVGGAFYYLFLEKLTSDFAGGEHSGFLKFLVDGRVSGMIDLAVILVGSSFLYALSQALEMPIAQGYQEVRDLEIGCGRKASKSGMWSPRWTSKWGR